MARSRLIKPGFFTNARLSALPPHARLLFAGLWTIADREGRLKDDAPTIKGAIFPHESDLPVEEFITFLARNKFILRYRIKGDRYIQIVTWKKHQSPHINEAASIIPAPNKHSAATAFGGTTPAVPDPEYGIRNTVSDPVPDPVAVAVTQPASSDAAAGLRRLCGGAIVWTPELNRELEETIVQSGLECVEHCLHEAARYNKLSWAYSEEIRLRHLMEGCPPVEAKTRRARLIASNG